MVTEPHESVSEQSVPTRSDVERHIAHIQAAHVSAHFQAYQLLRGCDSPAALQRIEHGVREGDEDCIQHLAESDVRRSLALAQELLEQGALVPATRLFTKIEQRGCTIPREILYQRAIELLQLPVEHYRVRWESVYCGLTMLALLGERQGIDSTLNGLVELGVCTDRSEMSHALHCAQRTRLTFAQQTRYVQRLHDVGDTCCARDQFHYLLSDLSVGVLNPTDPEIESLRSLAQEIGVPQLDMLQDIIDERAGRFFEIGIRNMGSSPHRAREILQRANDPERIAAYAHQYEQAGNLQSAVLLYQTIGMLDRIDPLAERLFAAGNLIHALDAFIMTGNRDGAQRVGNVFCDLWIASNTSTEFCELQTFRDDDVPPSQARRAFLFAQDTSRLMDIGREWERRGVLRGARKLFGDAGNVDALIALRARSVTYDHRIINQKEYRNCDRDAHNVAVRNRDIPALLRLAEARIGDQIFASACFNAAIAIASGLPTKEQE